MLTGFGYSQQWIRTSGRPEAIPQWSALWTRSPDHSPFAAPDRKAAGWSCMRAARLGSSRKPGLNCSPDTNPAPELCQRRWRTPVFLPIREVIESGPFVDLNCTPTATKAAGARLLPLFLARGVDHGAVRAGEMDDELGIVAHPQRMD
jgi:hypothetical protein